MKIQATIIPVTAYTQNCSLIWCTETNKGAVVDPGGDLDRILAAVKEHNVNLEKIFITHGHLDHAGGAADLAEQTGLPIEGPQKEDLFWIEQLATQGQQMGMADNSKPFIPDRWLEDGDQISFGNITMDVFHCPGHTPGHVVFYHKDTKLAIVGDVLFKGSIGRTDFPRGDHPTLIRSITEKLWPLGSDITFISGHGPLSTFGAERKTNPFVGDTVLS
jgi:hydroxyacylglutathione hydrolase